MRILARQPLERPMRIAGIILSAGMDSQAIAAFGQQVLQLVDLDGKGRLQSRDRLRHQYSDRLRSRPNRIAPEIANHPVAEAARRCDDAF